MAIRYGDRTRVSTGANTWIARPFNPIQAKPYFWLDASVPSSITESGGAISQWSDISGNDRHFTQSSGTAQPSYQTAIQNGLNVVRFDGSNDFLTRANFVSSATFSIFFAADINTNGILWENNLNASNQIYWYSNTGESVYVRVGGGTLLTYNVATAYLARQFFTSIGLTCDNSVDRLYMLGDKILKGGPFAQSGGASTGTGTFTGTATLGGRNGSLNMSADIGEVIMFDRFVSRTERGQIFDYLSDKWGLGA